MKNLKILFLTFCLLLQVLCSYAAGSQQKQCVVKLLLSNEDRIIKVDSGTVLNAQFFQENGPYNPPAPELVLNGWELVKGNPSIVVDTTVLKPKWITQEDAVLIQDSIAWERSYKSYTTKLVTDSIEEALSEPNQKKDFWLYVMLGLAILLSVTSLVLSLLLPKKYQKHLQDDEDFAETVVNIVKEHKELEKWNNPGKVAVKSTETPSTSYDSDICDLRGRVAELEDKLRNSTKENTTKVTTSSSQEKTKVPASSEQYLYADSIVDDKFNKVTESPSEDSVFELKLKGGSKASVTIYKPAYGKVLANASFLEGCDKQIMGYTSVHIDREGTSEKDDNGKWKVVNPLKVILK